MGRLPTLIAPKLVGGRRMVYIAKNIRTGRRFKLFEDAEVVAKCVFGVVSIPKGD